MRCYCTACRKTAGTGGYAINLVASAASLAVEGHRHVQAYSIRLADGTRSPGQRCFCSICGTALWIRDPRWPALIHPFASAIDTPLPVPPERIHCMVEFAPPWLSVTEGPEDRCFDGYPPMSIEEWHEAWGLAEPPPTDPGKT